MKITEVGDRLGVEVRYLPYWRLLMLASACLGFVVLFRPAESFTLMRYMTAGLLILVIPMYLMIIGRMGFWSWFHRGEGVVVIAERRGMSMVTEIRRLGEVRSVAVESRTDGDLEHRLSLNLADSQLLPMSYWKSSEKDHEQFKDAAERINAFLPNPVEGPEKVETERT